MERSSLSPYSSVIAFAAFSLCAAAFAFEEPVYTVATSGEGTNDLDAAMVEIAQNGETTTAAFSALTLTTGTLRKCGSGWLRSSDALAGFIGEIVVEEGAFIVSKDGQTGVVNTEAEGTRYTTNWTGFARLVVSNGATLVVDCSAATPHLRQPVTFGGEGYKGLGAIYNINASSSNSFYNAQLSLSDDALVCTRGSGRLSFGYSHMDMNGHTLTTRGIGGRGVHVFCGMAMHTPGHIVLDRMQGYFSATRAWDGTAENTVTATDDARFYMYNFGGTVPWTFINRCPDLLTYSSSGSATWNRPTHNRWDGPVQLEEDISFGSSSSSVTNHSMAFFGPFTGPAGFALKNFWIRLHSTSNTFEGGATIDSRGRLVLAGNGALPVNGGSVKVKNGGEILFVDDGQQLDTMDYPVMDWTVAANETVAFPGTTNCTVAGLVKRGAGTLDLAGPVSVTGVTELAAGTLRIPFEQAGLCEGWIDPAVADKTSGNDVIGKLQYVATNRVVLGAELAYTSNQVLWQRDPIQPWSLTLVYHGYIWNREPTNVTWIIAQSMYKGTYLYIDGSRVKGYGTPGATSGSEVSYYHGGTPSDNKRIAFYTVNVVPGPHRIDLRTYTQGSSNDTGRWGPCQYEPTNAVWKADFGWAIDWKGTKSTNCADYAEIRDPGDGSLFTTTTNGMNETLAALTPKFSHLKFTGGTFDARGSSLTVPVLECGGGTLTNSNAYAEDGTLTVGERLKVDGATYGGVLTVCGRLKFAEGATLDADSLSLLARSAEHALVTATGGIAGLPVWQPVDGVEKGWRLAAGKDGDGHDTLVFKWSMGTAFTIR